MSERDDRTVFDAERASPESAGPADEAPVGVDILAVLEAMLFASPEPLTTKEIAAALDGVDEQTVEHSLECLARALRAPDRGLRLEKVAGGYRLVTRPDLAEPLRALFRYRNRKRLTPASLDVLAIVAYAQPITAPEIQEIRGTDPSWALRQLLERRLIRVVGRKRVVGRPMLYGTTREFLLHFGLDSLEDLPPVEAHGTQVVPSQQRLFPVAGGGGAEGEEPVPDEQDAIADGDETSDWLGDPPAEDGVDETRRQAGADR
ncbi:MAG: hypothetical protein Kow0062_08630 [Acidobacteriota bacterium]